MTLIYFLLTRIAEDEASVEGDWFDGVGPSFQWGPSRIKAECAAKRRIVELHSEEADDMCQSCAGNYSYDPCPTLRSLASAYAEHPDYDDNWRP